jgi:hypothetical protein
MRLGNGQEQDKPRKRNPPGSVKKASEAVAEELGLAPSTVRKIYYEQRSLVEAIERRVETDRVKMLADVKWYQDHIGPFKVTPERLALWEKNQRELLTQFYFNGVLKLVKGELVEMPWP